MDAVDDAAFEAAVRDGLDAVPPELMAMADNVAIFVEDEPSAEHADPTLSDEDNAELLGIYLGTPLTERDGWWAGPETTKKAIRRGILKEMFQHRRSRRRMPPA